MTSSRTAQRHDTAAGGKPTPANSLLGYFPGTLPRTQRWSSTMSHHSIRGPAGTLEAVSSDPVCPPNTTPGHRTVVVIAHPHPLYGGNMDNAVVIATARAANSAGAVALRFNFRGTGRSQGSHDNGEGEVHDLTAALAWAQQHLEPDSLWLAGYSFGAAMILKSPALSQIAGALLIAPPLSLYRFESKPLKGKPDIPVAVICGADDDFTAPPHRAQLDALMPVLITDLPDVGHDLGTASGSASALNTALDQALSALMAAAGT